MAKRIISQARGRGGPRYRVNRRAFRYEIAYPRELSGEGVVAQILNSRAHSAPLAKIKHGGEEFYIPAFKGMYEGMKISFGNGEVKDGNIFELKSIPVKTKIYNIESKPKDGGVFIRTAGSYGIVSRISDGKVYVIMPSKKEKEFNENCRATIGEIAGAGRLDKPILKAGKRHHMMKSVGGRVWPRTSAVKMNVIDHPFGSGRGKNPKSKIAKRNAPPGRRVGHLRPSRTGYKK